MTWTTSTAGSSSSASSDGIGVADAEGRRTRRPALRRAAEDAADLDADPAQGFDVDRADEAGPDHGGADVGDLAHGRSQAWVDGLTRVGDAVAPGQRARLLATVRARCRNHPTLTCQVQKSLDERLKRRTIRRDRRRHAVRGPLPDESLDALVVVLDEVRLGRSRSRSELVARTGLGRAIVAQRVGELLERGSSSRATSARAPAAGRRASSRSGPRPGTCSSRTSAPRASTSR